MAHNNTRGFAVADCETDPFLYGRIPEPFIWGYYNGKEYHRFFSTDEFVEFIYDRKEVIYAHNGGKFDWHFLTEHLNEFDPLTIIAGRIAECKIGECTLRDSYSILPVPLSAMKKDDFDYSLMEKDKRGAHMHEIETYLQHDCVYLYDYIKEFREKYGTKLTLAGSAMNYWVKMAGGKAPQSDAEYYGSVSRFYHGGRVEVFKSGIINEPVKVYDIRSAYPYAMLSNHPYGLEYIHKCSVRPGEDFNFKNQGFYFVLANSIGALPTYIEGKFCFPSDGEFRGFYATGWEINEGLNHGLKVNLVYESYEFTEQRNFAEYVHHFYDMKKNAEKGTPDYLFAKLFMNSLYGKFGANPNEYNEFCVAPRDARPSPDSEWKLCHVLDNGKLIIQKPLEEEQMRFYNVATAASITGFVRAMLFRAIKSTDRPYYCDTDSVIFSGAHDLDLGDELGQWDFEGEFQQGGFAGKKLYALKNTETDEEKTASKGVKLSYSEIMRVAKGEEITYKNDAPTFSVTRGVNFVKRRVNKTT